MLSSLTIEKKRNFIDLEIDLTRKRMQLHFKDSDADAGKKTTVASLVSDACRDIKITCKLLFKILTF